MKARPGFMAWYCHTSTIIHHKQDVDTIVITQITQLIVLALANYYWIELIRMLLLYDYSLL